MMTILLTALEYSRSLQELCALPVRAGRVHSIFRRALNIVLADTIISLVSEELPRMPNGIHISSATMKLLSQQIQLDTTVLVGDGKLSIPACNVALPLSGVALWEPRPHVEQYHWNRVIVSQHAQALAYHLVDCASPESFASLVGPLLLARSIDRPTGFKTNVYRALESLLRAAKESDLVTIEGAVDILIGLGPGFTPAGDDILCGFIAIIVLLSPYLSSSHRVHDWLIGMIVRKARTNTTLLSTVLLEYAARGEIAEQIGDLLLSLALPLQEQKTVIHAAQRLLSFGATSGADTLLGILLGIRNLEDS